MRKLLLVLSAVFLVTACSEVQKIDNGQIPQEYNNDIQPFLGNWAGSFHGHEGHLELNLNNSNQLIVEFKDSATNDLLPGCESSIGLLKEVEFKEKDNRFRVYRATFAMDTNKCSNSIRGQQIHFYFNKAQTSANLELLHKQWRDYQCRIEGQDPNGAPIHRCEHVIRERHFRGQFSLLNN